MDKKTICITEALRARFADAFSNKRMMFFAANGGYGKTTAVRMLLEGQRVAEVSAAQSPLDFPKDEAWEVLFVDDLHELDDTKEQQALVAFIQNHPDKKFIFASRGSAVPGWLIGFQFSGDMEVLTAKDLAIDAVCLKKLLAQEGVVIDDEVTLQKILQTNYGYPMAISTLARRIKEEGCYNEKVAAEGYNELYRYWEHHFFDALPSQLQRFCTDMAVFDTFSLGLAEMVTGNRRARALVEGIQHQSAVLTSTGRNSYQFTPIGRGFLVWMMERSYSEEERKGVYDRAGLYYELEDDYSMAMACYHKGDDKERMALLLEKNAQTSASMAHYQQIAPYYHALPEEALLASPALMQGMSMLCALENNYDASEKWYQALKARLGGPKTKEVRGRVAWLDICLPQRDVRDLAKNVAAIFALVRSCDIDLDTMSVTNAQPSVMNGGKDFSVWSKRDDLLYKTIRVPLEGILGRDGVALGDCAITESKLEKGEDVSVKMLSLMTRLSEVQLSGTPDIEFAIIGQAVRLQLQSGATDEAWRSVQNLRKRYEERELTRFMPNIDALLCRIALRSGDYAYVEEWYNDKAPRDAFDIWVLKRYSYLTEAMAAIALGRYDAALMTLAPLENYFTTCRRHIDGIHLHLLRAIALYRTDREWQEELAKALEAAAGFGFVTTIAEYGAAVVPLLDKCTWQGNKEFLARTLRAARNQASYYPSFMQPKNKLVEALTPAELQVLRLLCFDKSNQEIADVLGVKLSTIKTQVRSILHKLGVKRRSEAKTAAQELKLL